MALRELPTFYYHAHFAEFLEFVEGPSAHLLNDTHRQWLNAYKMAEHLQQCLVVRLINRKYPIIKITSLVFAEIPDISGTLEALRDMDFARNVNTDDVAQLLDVLTKVELSALYDEVSGIDDLPESAAYKPIVKSANKAVFAKHCQQLCHKKIAKSQVARQYIVSTSDHHIAYFLYLYFGHNHGKLNQFSMRDLGLMRTREEEAQMLSRFSDYDSAYSSFSLQHLYSKLKRYEFTNVHDIQALIDAIPKAYGQQAISIDAKIRLLLSKKMLEHDAHSAIALVNESVDPVAQEYWCRQAYKLDLKEQVERKLNAIIDDPISDKLLQFAEDFLARKYKQKRTSILTDMLRENTRHLCIDETFKGSVEQGVIAYYQSRGIQAWRSENTLWQNLFGLCFWHELFELDGLGLATPFDYLPNSLKHHNLMDVAGDRIQERLDAIPTASAFLLLLTKHMTAHFGKSQGIVRWHNNMLDKLKILVEHAPLDGLKAQLLTMCQNWQLYNDGYPDIMVLENKQLRFEEVKSEGDSLRRNQLLQIQSLRDKGIDVGVTTVNWTLDPMQAYAVIDIETTGGRAGSHKITEIGMVKMINGEVVDQWQSLINPQRRIPSMITSLTGISNDMVSDAPLFSDIADEVENFTENCIFVAHNVNFDYGFIKEEFARINRHYRRPKLCTVQQMRKHYKGLTSYSLANLTKHFDIKMQRHHRALSDAVAAAELLKLVNESRFEKQKAAERS